MSVWILLVLTFMMKGPDVVGAQPIPMGQFETQEDCQNALDKVIQDPKAKESLDKHLAAIACVKMEKE